MIIILSILFGLIWGILIGIVIGLKLANLTLGIPKGYKVDKVTFKKLED